MIGTATWGEIKSKLAEFAEEAGVPVNELQRIVDKAKNYLNDNVGEKKSSPQEIKPAKPKKNASEVRNKQNKTDSEKKDGVIKTDNKKK